MPSVSQKQHNLMAMVANNPAKAKELGIPQKVGQEFAQADKGLKFGAGPKTRPDLQKVNKPSTRHGKTELFKEGGQVMATKKMMKGGITTAKMGKVTSGGIKKHGEHTVQKRGHTKAAMPKMAGAKPLGMKKGGKAC